MTTKTLINLSNHPSSKWSNKQKEGWDNIIDIQFPNIPASILEVEIQNNYVEQMYNQLKDLTLTIGGNTFYIMLQGEFTFCYLLYSKLKNNNDNNKWYFCIPSTERFTIETIKNDGSVEKVSSFEFVRWRII